MYKIITPRLKTGERLNLQVSPEDGAKVKRGCRWTATVTDIPTGKTYRLKSAACSLPGCLCDAVVVDKIP